MFEKTDVPREGDVLEFFDGEGFVSGTVLKTEKDDEEVFPTEDSVFVLQVGDTKHRVHHTDVVGILRRKGNRE